MPYPRVDHFKPNDFQRELLIAAFRKPFTVAETAVRTGKSGAIAVYHRTQAKYNPGCQGLMVVPSYKWYRRVMHRVCNELFGHEARFHGTDYIWTWPRFADAEVVVVSAEQVYNDPTSAEGFTAAWASFDETQDLARSVYEVILARISDKRARFPHCLLCGLPEFDSWPENLAKSMPPERVAYFDSVATGVNAEHILAGYADNLADGLSPDEYQRKVLGIKPLPKGRCFKDFLPAPYVERAALQGGSIIEWEYDPALPLRLGVDFGRRFAAVFVQRDPVKDLDVIVAEQMLDGLSTEFCATRLREIAAPRNEVKAGDKRMRVDVVSADPAGNSFQSATGMKDIQVLQDVFGMPVRYTYDTKLRSIRHGVELINSRLLNAAGKRRLVVARSVYEASKNLGPLGRSIALSLLRMRYPEDRAGRPTADEPIKDGLDDHAGDALRYDIVNEYGRASPKTLSVR